MADTVVRRGRNGKPQVRATHSNGWTKKRRETFLNTLAETCNVTASARAAGVWPSNAYKLRRSDAEFAALWRAAMVVGYDRLEARLLEVATSALNDIDLKDPGDTKSREINFDNAVKLLRTHRGAVAEGRTRSADAPRRRATQEETDAALIRKLDALDRRRKAKNDRK
ncbi:hypothetical protein [Stakelama saccharophila]|uniref:Terminase small subunit n=1 Tax=Stakelama saccharophila TaxID=3075605 RepID=A0ABZ0B8F9_9SPHN|nr:hypothetical protein [Stakelama sp. W311]WNO53553.1 hypothetical protein RPR59_14105 [Stakelama sp. W311]